MKNSLRTKLASLTLAASLIIPSLNILSQTKPNQSYYKQAQDNPKQRKKFVDQWDEKASQKAGFPIDFEYDPDFTTYDSIYTIRIKKAYPEKSSDEVKEMLSEVQLATKNFSFYTPVISAEIGKKKPQYVFVKETAFLERFLVDFEAATDHEIQHCKDIRDGIKLGKIVIIDHSMIDKFNYETAEALFESRAYHSQLKFYHHNQPLKESGYNSTVRKYAQHYNLLKNLAQKDPTFSSMFARLQLQQLQDMIPTIKQDGSIYLVTPEKKFYIH